MGLLGKSAKKQLASLQFAVLDFETSGLEASEHRVIEAALVLMNGAGTVEHEWTTLVNPGDAKSGSKKIHGIDDTWLAAAPTFGSVIGDIRDRITGRVLVAHNHAFDLGFLRSELLRAGIAEGVELLFLDTMDLAEALGLPKRLQDACAEVGITYAAHNALEDARATAQLLAALLERVDPSTFANNPVVPPNWLTTSVAATGAYMWRDSAAQLTTAKDIVASIGFHLPPQPPSPERDLLGSTHTVSASPGPSATISFHPTNCTN